MKKFTWVRPLDRTTFEVGIGTDIEILHIMEERYRPLFEDTVPATLAGLTNWKFGNLYTPSPEHEKLLKSYLGPRSILRWVKVREDGYKEDFYYEMKTIGCLHSFKDCLVSFLKTGSLGWFYFLGRNRPSEISLVKN